jgi:ribosomal protein S18 acetylase RimI-like enzyme
VETRDALELADANLAEATREMCRWHDAVELREVGDLLLVAGVDPFPVGYNNAAMALGTEPPAEPSALIAEAERFFTERGRGYTLWTREHLDGALAEQAQAAGLHPVPSMPGMLLDAPVREREAPSGARIELLRDPAQVTDFAEVSARAYAAMGLPPDLCRRMFSMPTRVLRPHVLMAVAYRDDAPVAAAQAILSQGIAGVYWVGTVPEARKTGLGEACTRAVGNAAFERGATCVVLQASEQGEPIYRRMGYREITRYAWWVRPPREG